MKKIIIFAAILSLIGCDKQRDLYVTAGPMIYAEGDWLPSLKMKDMSMNATAVLYDADGLYAKEYFFAPNSTIIPVEKGTYDVMIFNGLMYSPEDSHLDQVFFRGTDNINTFEAVAREAEPVKRLGRSDGEYIASNEMEIITSALQRQTIESNHSYYLKYKNGKNGYPVPDNYIEAELYMTPEAMSYESQITVTIDNISSAYGANAALYGFVGSAFVATREPSHFYVTHQFNLNHKKMIAGNDRGTIESPVFVTFGPPLDVPEKKYEVYIRITLVDNTVFEQIVDVTSQVLPVLDVIKNNINKTKPVQYGLTIPLEIEIVLPVAEPIQGGINLSDWGDDEIIRVPIK